MLWLGKWCLPSELICLAQQVQWGGGGSCPLRPPLATALSLEGVHSCLAVSEPYWYVYDVGLVSTQLGANGTVKASRPPSGDILRSSLLWVSMFTLAGFWLLVLSSRQFKYSRAWYNPFLRNSLKLHSNRTNVCSSYMFYMVRDHWFDSRPFLVWWVKAVPQGTSSFYLEHFDVISIIISVYTMENCCLFVKQRSSQIQYLPQSVSVSGLAQMSYLTNVSV